MFKIGFRSRINERDLKAAKKAGIEVIEIMYYDVTRERKDEVAGLLKEYDIKPSALGPYPQRDLDELKRDMEYTRLIGCPVYIGHPDPLAHGEFEKIREFKAFWKEACQIGMDNGVRVTIHTCGLGPESWDIMLNEVPELGLKYDPSFSAQAGRSYRDEILRYGSRILHVHAKDEMQFARISGGLRGVIPMQYAPPGMGDIHWGSVIALLYEVGFKGDIAIEVHSKYWESDEAFLRGLILGKRHLEQFMA